MVLIRPRSSLYFVATFEPEGPGTDDLEAWLYYCFQVRKGRKKPAVSSRVVPSHHDTTLWLMAVDPD